MNFGLLRGVSSLSVALMSRSVVLLS